MADLGTQQRLLLLFLVANFDSNQLLETNLVWLCKWKGDWEKIRQILENTKPQQLSQLERLLLVEVRFHWRLVSLCYRTYAMELDSHYQETTRLVKSNLKQFASSSQCGCKFGCTPLEGKFHKFQVQRKQFQWQQPFHFENRAVDPRNLPDKCLHPDVGLAHKFVE